MDMTAGKSEANGVEPSPRRFPLWSSAALVAANLVPLWGVLFGGWSVLTIMVLFWVENLVIGGFNVLKMLTVRVPGPVGIAAKAFMVPFFTVHYGVFCLVHGVFVFLIFGGSMFGGHAAQPFADAPAIVRPLFIPILALITSHGVSFYTNFLRGGEWLRTPLPSLMGQPYGRVVILHVTILLGAFLVMITGSGTAPLVLLTVLKTGADLVAHLRQNGGFTVRDLVTEIAARTGRRYA